MKRWIALLAVLFSIVLVGSGNPPPCWGTSLISFTDNNSTTTAWFNYGIIAAGVPPAGVAAVSWTQTVGTTNTIIGAMLSGIHDYVSGIDYYGGGQAYLMNALGPGTTTLNEIATASFANVPILSDIMDLNSQPVTTLFTGLSLDPGTYYLVVEMTQNRLAWLGDYMDVGVNTATGFTVGSFLDSLNPAAYPPASSFSTLTDGTNLITLFFTVDSTVVPTPATILLLGSGLLGLGAWRRLRKG